jgi:hypothetical protein
MKLQFNHGLIATLNLETWTLSILSSFVFVGEYLYMVQTEADFTERLFLCATIATSVRWFSVRAWF